MSNQASPSPGGRKVEVKLVANRKIRQVTFSKRRKSLFKKAMQLSLLCDAQVSLTIVSSLGKVFRYESAGHSLNISPEQPLESYYSNDDYAHLYGGGGADDDNDSIKPSASNVSDDVASTEGDRPRIVDMSTSAATQLMQRGGRRRRAGSKQQRTPVKKSMSHVEQNARSVRFANLEPGRVHVSQSEMLPVGMTDGMHIPVNADAFGRSVQEYSGFPGQQRPPTQFATEQPIPFALPPNGIPFLDAARQSQDVLNDELLQSGFNRNPQEYPMNTIDRPPGDPRITFNNDDNDYFTQMMLGGNIDANEAAMEAASGFIMSDDEPKYG